MEVVTKDEARVGGSNFAQPINKEEEEVHESNSDDLGDPN